MKRKNEERKRKRLRKEGQEGRRRGKNRCNKGIKKEKIRNN